MYYYFTDKLFTMRNQINIKGNNQVFPYIIEYSKNAVTLNGDNVTNGEDILYYKENDKISFFENTIEYYRDKNNWYHISNLPISNMSIDNYIPNIVKTSNIKVYIPTHSISTYVNNIKYSLTLNTWINGVKLELGTFIFNPIDTIAIPSGTIKCGNNEYYEYISFNIIDPFYLIYSDEWKEFREKECKETVNTNSNSSVLYVSLNVLEDSENGYILKNDYIGGCTNFNISEDNDFLKLMLNTSIDPLGFVFNIKMNEVYDSFQNYLLETYGLSPTYDDIVFDLIIKNKDNIIYDPLTARTFNAIEEFGNVEQRLLITNLAETNLIRQFLSDWNNFEEGWSIVGSLTIYNNQYYKTGYNVLTVNETKDELLSFISNEIPITQELFSMFANGGSEKIIDIKDMNINTYNVVNKIENNIYQIERPNESKSNIIQPVFFRVKDTEMLTLHPDVTENISINLDDYKSKVQKFILKIGDCTFEQIGANSYGILFKITANSLAKTVVSGTYYILNENYELVTSGKFNCVR